MTAPADSASLGDWLAWLETLSPREIVLGLERVTEILARLQLDPPGMVVIVGGTNGKGSSVAMLDLLLRHHGLRTGSYTSPHLRRYNERICIDGRPADDASILAALRQIESVREDIPLTFFEFGTLAALVVFATENVGAWVLEVGLGGRLDAVNALEPDVSLITNVALDHALWLGDNTESIGREKAGIMRQSKPVVFGSADVPDSIRAAANEIGADLRIAGTDFEYSRNSNDDASWAWRGRSTEIVDLAALTLPGEVQLHNAAAVLAAIEALGIDGLLNVAAINGALSRLELKGRFQVITQDCPWILDVAHNPAAAQALADRLAQRRVVGAVTAVLGMLQDKDVAGVLKPLTACVDRWVAVPIDGVRGASAVALARTISKQSNKPCKVAASINAGLEYAAGIVDKGGAVLVTGSFHVVGPALDWLDAPD